MDAFADCRNASPAARPSIEFDVSEVSPVSSAGSPAPLAAAAAQSSKHFTVAATNDSLKARCLGVASSACDSSARTAKTSACMTSAP